MTIGNRLAGTGWPSPLAGKVDASLTHKNSDTPVDARENRIATLHLRANIASTFQDFIGANITTRMTVNNEDRDAPAAHSKHLKARANLVDASPPSRFFRRFWVLVCTLLGADTIKLATVQSRATCGAKKTARAKIDSPRIHNVVMKNAEEAHPRRIPNLHDKYFMASKTSN